MVTSQGSPDRRLYRWQLDALVSWVRCGRRGIIEAVTGSGKTEVAIAAASDALRRGRFVLVLVPSRVLMSGRPYFGKVLRPSSDCGVDQIGGRMPHQASLARVDSDARPAPLRLSGSILAAASGRRTVTLGG